MRLFNSPFCFFLRTSVQFQTRVYHFFEFHTNVCLRTTVKIRAFTKKFYNVRFTFIFSDPVGQFRQFFSMTVNKTVIETDSKKCQVWSLDSGIICVGTINFSLQTQESGILILSTLIIRKYISNTLIALYYFSGGYPTITKFILCLLVLLVSMRQPFDCVKQNVN